MVQIWEDFTPNCSFFVTSTKLSGKIDFMGSSEKLVLIMDKIFAFPCFSYTILLLLKTEKLTLKLAQRKNNLHR